MTPRKIEVDIMKKATFFTFTLRAWGNRRKADVGTVDTKAEKSMLRLTKELINSPEFKAIRSFQGSVKSWCTAHSMPSFFKTGIFLVKLDEVQAFEDYLTGARKELQDNLIPALLAKYPAQIEAAKVQLSEMFNASDYPTPANLASRFSIEHGWISFGVPDNLPAAVRKQEEIKIRKAFEEAKNEILAALRAQFGELVTRAADRFKAVGSKKQPLVLAPMLESFDQFFETFNSKNLMEDAELAAVVAEAKAILSGVNPADIKKSAAVRSNLAKAFGKVKGSVDKLITERPSRKFNLDDEAE